MAASVNQLLVPILLDESLSDEELLVIYLLVNLDNVPREIGQPRLEINSLSGSEFVLKIVSVLP